MHKLLVALLVIAGLYGCAGRSAAVNQVLPGATVHQDQRSTATLPSGTRVYDLPVSAIRTPDRKNTIWVPSAAIVSQSGTSVTFLLGNGSLKTVSNVIVEKSPTAHMTVSLKPGAPVPPALTNIAPSYVVP